MRQSFEPGGSCEMEKSSSSFSKLEGVALSFADVGRTRVLEQKKKIELFLVLRFEFKSGQKNHVLLNIEQEPLFFLLVTHLLNNNNFDKGTMQSSFVRRSGIQDNCAKNEI